MMSINTSELEGGPPKKKRRSKWDIPAPDTTPSPSQAPPMATPTDPSGAAAAAAAKLNAMLAAQGKLIKCTAPPLLPPNPSVVPPSSNTLAPVSRPAPRTSDSGTIASEIDINDLDIRGHLTKSPTLSELNRTTGAFVSVRGRYFRPGDRPQGPGDRPLHLHIQASSQDKVNAAVHRINEIITSSGHPGRAPRAPPPGSAPHMPIAPLFPGAGNLPGGMHYVQDKVFVGLEQVPEAFKLLDKLQGPGGAFLSHIATQTGAKIHLRGRGSGFIEPTSGKESFEALYIYISHSNSEGLGAARKLCVNLTDTVRQEHEGWRRSQQPLGFGGFAPHYGPPPPRHHGYRGPYHQQPPYGPPPPGYGAPPPGYQSQGHMLPHGPPHGYAGAPPPGPEGAPPPGPGGVPPHGYAGAPPPGSGGAPPHGYAGAPPPGPGGVPPHGYAGAPPPAPGRAPPPAPEGPPTAGPGGAPPYGYTEAPPPGPGRAPPPGPGGAPPPGPPSVPPYNYYPPPAHGGYFGPPRGYGGCGPPPVNYQQPPPGPAPEQQPGPNAPPPPGPAPPQQPHPQSGQHWHPDAQFPNPPPKRRFTEQVEATPTGKGMAATHTEMQVPQPQPQPQAAGDVPTPPSATEDLLPEQRVVANPDTNPMRRFTEVLPPDLPEKTTVAPPEVPVPLPTPVSLLQQSPGSKWKPLTSAAAPPMPLPSAIPTKGPKNSQLMPPPSSLPGNKGLKVASQESSAPVSVTSAASETPSKKQSVSLVAYTDDSDSDSDI